MPKVIGIRFRGTGKAYHFAPGDLELRLGDAVIVETTQGIELGIVAEEVIEIPEEKLIAPLKQVLRIASTEDMVRYDENTQKEKEAFHVGQEKIASRGLDMHLVDVNVSFDSRKIVFYFTADGRVDFRELVKDLASVFHTRIELRQIGVRDQARMVCGLGICGRELCCCSYLNDFVPVSIKMAKMQNLSMNPTKISGMCGRLMCCLKYEQAAYEDATARMPKQGAIVMTSEGQGYIEHVNLLKETVTVRLDRGGEADLLTVPYEELSLTGGRVSRRYPSGNGNGSAAPAAERPAAGESQPESEMNGTAGTARRRPARENRTEKRESRPEQVQDTKAEGERPKKRRSGRRGSGSRRRGRTGRPQGAEGAGEKPAQGSSD
ncbi:MAG: stage 0 sporulation family protein [Clostridiales bacterium]|nr:stage 0 sporulation family protein [Clostridiales bacterium]